MNHKCMAFCFLMQVTCKSYAELLKRVHRGGMFELAQTWIIPIGLPIRVLCIRSWTEEIEIVAMTTALAARCPTCHGLSRRIHSRYQRQLGHLPMGNQRVSMVLHTRRFFCDMPGCTRGVFTERVPGWMAPYSRRTVFVDDLLEMIACLLGGRTGSKAAQRLRLGKWSRDALLRLTRRSPPEVASTPRVLGVDDWAKCKGQTYGTILCDLETHRVIDLLADRESQTVADWLTAHAGVEVICRDRAGAYAEGARLGAPQAQQVADRFHLLTNLRDALERSLEQHRAQLIVHVAKVPSRSSPHVSKDEGGELVPSRRFNHSYEVAVPRVQSQLRQHQEAKRDLRRGRYQQARDLKAQGLSLRHISRIMKATRRTLRRFLEADHFPEHARRGARLKPFNDYLRQRWEAGVRNAHQLYTEIQARGYAGSYLEVTRWVQPWRAEAPPALPASPALASPPSEVTVTETRSPRQVSYWLVLPPDRLTAEQSNQLKQLLTAQPQLVPLHTWAQAFRTLLLTHRSARPHSADPLQEWINAVSGSNQPELKEFAQGLRRDAQAVNAAMTTPYSSGQVEGQINRLKLIKRMMYGRGKLDLLRKRVMFSLA